MEKTRLEDLKEKAELARLSTHLEASAATFRKDADSRNNHLLYSNSPGLW